MKIQTGERGYVQGATAPKSPASSSAALSRPRTSGPSISRSVSIADIKSRISGAHVLALCQAWLPGGRKQGGWWMARSPWREDHTPSLGVSLTTGIWKDFATGDGGDIIDLSMRLFGDNLKDTIRGFAEMLGMDNA